MHITKKDGSVASVEGTSNGDYGDETCYFLTNTYCFKQQGKFQCQKR